MGLVGMRERVTALDGRMSFETRDPKGHACAPSSRCRRRIVKRSLRDMGAPINILHVDDHAVVREGYRSLLQKQANLHVVGEARDGLEAYRLFKTLSPELVVMDLTMPGSGGIEAIRRIRQWDRAAKILVFTMHQTPAYAIQAIGAGAKGYVTRSSLPDALLRAIADVLDGRLALGGDMDHALALDQLAAEPRAIDVLTPREFEVLQMILSE